VKAKQAPKPSPRGHLPAFVVLPIGFKGEHTVPSIILEQ
jgi:hypothetical protein